MFRGTSTALVVIQQVFARQAPYLKFLVKGAVPLAWFTRIGVMSEAKAEQVRRLLAQYEVNLSVDVVTDWRMFAGQAPHLRY